MYARNVNFEKIGHPDYPDMVYYNLDIINGKTIDEGIYKNPKARFNETRDTAIIKDTSKYYFSIVRFDMNGSDKTLPMFIPRIELGQEDPNKSVYVISLKYTIDFNQGGASGKATFYSQKPIIYKPQNVSVVEPRPPLQTQDLETQYYYVYNYQHWVDLVNETYVEIFADLQTQLDTYVSSLGGTPFSIATRVPYMIYNQDTGRFSIYCDENGFGDNPTSPSTQEEKFNMYFNSNMYGLFSNMPHTYLGGDSASANTEGLDNYCYEILVKQHLNLNYATYSGTNYIIVNQDYKSTSSLWSPISSIVFVSTLIPVLAEQTGAPVQFGANNVSTSVGTQSAFTPIITDISLPMTQANNYNEFLSYTPTAEYRLSTLSNSPQEVRNIDIQVFWKSRLDGNLYPIELFNLSTISVKILFRRRDYTS